MWIKRNDSKNCADVFCTNVGIGTPTDANFWFVKSKNDEYTIKGIPEASILIRNNIGKPFLISGDFDVDGITSVTELYKTLRWIGCRNVEYDIPKRHSEGFGINRRIVDDFVAAHGTDATIITCDNGIAQIDVINYAKSLGLRVIIIDHHLPNTDDNDDIVLPNADVIIDPNAIKDSAEFNGYCGAGLCYKLASYMMSKDYSNKLLALAMIGTIADVMPLIEENYVIARFGLKAALNPNLCPPGLYALLTTLGFVNALKSVNVAYKIAPCINSASRMKDDGALDVVKLLCYEGAYYDAVEMAKGLVEVNNQRITVTKTYEQTGLEIAKTILQSNSKAPLVVYLPDAPVGIVGILAGRYADTLHIPTIVVCDSDGMIRGSARTSGDYNIKASLDECSEYLTTYGGHKEAGGIFLEKNKLESFISAIHDSNESKRYIPSNSVDDIFYDFEVQNLQTAIREVYDDSLKYEPYGAHNEKPVVMIRDAVVQGVFVIKDTYLKIKTAHFDTFSSMADRKSEIAVGDLIDVVGTVNLNVFRNVETCQIDVLDFRKSES